jgi:hypothetical protein
MEIAGALLSDYHFRGSMSTWTVAESLGESRDKVYAAYKEIIVSLQMKDGRMRPFYCIDSVKVKRLAWP